LAEQRATAPVAAVGGPAAGAVPATTTVGVSPGGLWGWVMALVLAVLSGFILGQRHMPAELLVLLALLIVTAAAAFEAGRRGARR